MGFSAIYRYLLHLSHTAHKSAAPALLLCLLVLKSTSRVVLLGLRALKNAARASLLGLLGVKNGARALLLGLLELKNVAPALLLGLLELKNASRALLLGLLELEPVVELTDLPRVGLSLPFFARVRLLDLVELGRGPPPLRAYLEEVDALAVRRYVEFRR